MLLSNRSGEHLGTAPLGQSPVSVIRRVGKRMDGNPSTGHEDTAHLYISGSHEFNKVIEDNVDTVLMKITVIAEAEQV